MFGQRNNKNSEKPGTPNSNKNNNYYNDNQFKETAGFKPFGKSNFAQQDNSSKQYHNNTNYNLNNNSNNNYYNNNNSYNTNNNRNSMYPFSESGNDVMQYSQSNIYGSNIQKLASQQQQQQQQQQHQQVQQTPRRLDILTNNNSILRESSVLFMSKLHFKPFNYGRCLEKLNVNMLENINIDQIEYTSDLSSAQQMLKNIAFTEYNTEVVEKMGFHNFNKIFRLWQTAILNYGIQQQEEQQKGEKLYTKYRIHLESSQRIDEIKKSHADKKTKLYEQIKTLQWQINELKSKSQTVGKFKCTYCNKMFENKETIRSHIKASHQDKIQKIKQEQKVLSNLGNPITHLTRREERQIQEDNLNIANKVAQEVEEKMNKQLQILFEKHKELSKRKRDEEERNEYNNETNDELALNQKHLLNSISKMNGVFGGFEEMFAQMQTKQQNLIEEQTQYNKRLKEIEMDQRKLELEKEKQSKEIQEQLKLVQYNQNKQLQQQELSISRNDDDSNFLLHSESKPYYSTDLKLQKEPSFGNPYMNNNPNSQRDQWKQSNSNNNNNNNRRGVEDDYFLEEVEEDENKENNYYMNKSQQRSALDQYYQSQSIMNTQQNQTNYLTQNESSFSKKSDLKKQFKDKYRSEENQSSHQDDKKNITNSISNNNNKNRKKEQNHIGDLESDYDSDLLNESYEEGVLQPTNQHHIIRKAELQFKERLMTQQEMDDILKNKNYKQTIARNRDQIDDQRRKKYNYPFETNKILQNFSSLEQEKIRNERLIEEVMQMQEIRGKRDSGGQIDQDYPIDYDLSLISQQHDIQNMKKQFIKNQLQFHDDIQDIDNLDQDQLEKLKLAYQSKYNPKQIQTLDK